MNELDTLNDPVWAFRPGTILSLPQIMSCPLCSGTFRVRGFTRHLNKCLVEHDMGADEYEDTYPGVLYGPISQFVSKLRTFIGFEANRFGLMRPSENKRNGKARYAWIDSDTKQEWYYSEWKGRIVRRPDTCPLFRNGNGRLLWRELGKQFKDHFDGTQTLALEPRLDNSCTFIDLDSHRMEEFQALVERLLDFHLHFYIVFSGSKGYHFWIFWDRILPNAQLVSIQDHLCHDIAVDRSVYPFQRGLVKLPLGVHQGTITFCGFVDYTGQAIPLDQQFDYFLNMRQNKVPMDLLTSAVDSGRIPETSGVTAHHVQMPDRKVDCVSPEWQMRAAQCQVILDEGTIPEELSREKLLFRLAVHAKDELGLSRTACIDRLITWSSQIPTGRSPRELNYDVERQVRVAYERDVHYSSGCLPELSDRQRNVISQYAAVALNMRVLRCLNGTLDRRQRVEAISTITCIAEYLTRLLIRHNGECYVSFTSIARSCNISVKTMHKWLPQMCRERWFRPKNEYRAPTENHAFYQGNMFVRAGCANIQGMAQEYVFMAGFAQDLGLVDSSPEELSVPIWWLQEALLESHKRT